MKQWCAVLLLLLVPVLARAEDALIVAAQQAAATGDYHAAIQDYERAMQQGGYSAPLLFNLGNAWLRLGKPAQAIVYYERALALSPGDAAVETNLAQAQQRAGLAPPVVGRWVLMARTFSLDTYAWIALGSIWVLCIALVMLCLTRPLRRIAWPLILAAAVGLCASADAAALCWSDLYRAVAMQPAMLHLAPADSAAASGTLREGEVVWLQERFGGFAYVRAADGRTGWVGADAVTAVRALPP